MQLGDAWGYDETTADPTAAWAQALESIKTGTGAIAQSSATWADLAQNIAGVLQTVALTDAQRRLLNIQLERARAGQPPLDASQYGLGVNVGISPTLQNGVLLLGLGALALFALKRR